MESRFSYFLYPGGNDIGFKVPAHKGPICDHWCILGSWSTRLIRKTFWRPSGLRLWSRGAFFSRNCGGRTGRSWLVVYLPMMFLCKTLCHASSCCVDYRRIIKCAESIVTDFVNGAGNINVFQFLAACKCIGANFFTAIWNYDICKLITVSKSTIS